MGKTPQNKACVLIPDRKLLYTEPYFSTQDQHSLDFENISAAGFAAKMLQRDKLN